jgi:hypothetical protein
MTLQRILFTYVGAARSEGILRMQPRPYLWYIGGQDLPTWFSTQMGTLRIHKCALNQMSSCSTCTIEESEGRHTTLPSHEVQAVA